MPLLPTSIPFGARQQDLDVSKQLALLRQLQAQQQQEEAKAQMASTQARLADPYEKAKADAQAESFRQRRDVQEMGGGGMPAPIPQPQRGPMLPGPIPDVLAGMGPQIRPVGTSGSSAIPRRIGGVRRITEGEMTPTRRIATTPFGLSREQAQTRSFSDSPMGTETRQAAEAVRDPNFPDALAGDRARAELDPRVMAADVEARGRRDAAALKAQPGGTSAYAAERAKRNLQSVDELSAKVSRWNTGSGSVFANLPATDARNFKAELDTLKANIAFGELTAMREASKTGGALGAVSEREMALLTAALGALDTGQSTDNFKSQLAKVRDSVDRWSKEQQRLTGVGGGDGTVRARDPQGNLHEAPAGTPLPDGWEEVD